MTDDTQHHGEMDHNSDTPKPTWINTRALYSGFVEFTKGGHTLHHLEMSHATMRYIVVNSEDVPPNALELHGRPVQYDDGVEFRIIRMVSDDGREVMSFKVSNQDDMLDDDD